MTNNAARTAADVAAAIASLGVEANAAEVLTSSQVAAEVLLERFGHGAAVLAVGGEGLREPLADVGLRVVDTADASPVAVVQGWAPEVGWRMLAEATVAIRAGAAWVATNLDATLPSPRGPLPGNGSMVAALATATGHKPESVGKPERAMFDRACAGAGAQRPLAVGDRLETDVAGAVAAAIPSLIVLTGVSTPADLLAAPADQRPTYVGRDLRALAQPPYLAEADSNRSQCAGVIVDVDGSVNSSGIGDGRDPGIAGLTAACALAWSGALPPDRYSDVLHRLDLD